MKIRNLSQRAKKFLLDGGFNPKDDLNKARNPKGRTALTYAINQANSEVVQELINAKVDINLADDSKQTINPLTAAIHSINLNPSSSSAQKTLDILLSQPNIDLDCQGGGTPLMAAVVTNNMIVFERLLKMGANPNAVTTEHENSALICACKLGLSTFVKRLLELPGLNVNHKNKQGYAALAMAIHANNEEILGYLLNHSKINLEIEDNIGMKPLNLAAVRGFMGAVKMFLEKGANANAKNIFNETPLTAACNIGNLEMAKLLVSYKAEVNVYGHLGQSPLGNAMFKGHHKVVQFLLRNGASKEKPVHNILTDFETKGVVEGTPILLNILTRFPIMKNSGKIKQAVDKNVALELCRAASENDLHTINSLLALETDPNIQHQKDGLSWAPLHYACRSGHLEAARLLIQRGANKFLKTSTGKTPLQIANKLLDEELKEEFESLLSFRIHYHLPRYRDFLASSFFWLRPVFAADYTAMVDCYKDPVSMKYWGSGITYNSEGTQERVLFYANCNLAFKNLKNDIHYNETCAWSIITHDGIAGFVFAWKMDVDEIEIAYIIRPRFAGKGLSTDAGQLIINTKCCPPIFSGTITATAHPDNIASQKVLAKLGLTPDPHKQRVFIPRYNSVRNYYLRTVLPENEAENESKNESEAAKFSSMSL